MRNKRKPRLLNSESKKALEKENTLYYNLGIVVRWDDRKAALNVKKHGVTFEEAATVFYAASSLELEDSRHNEQRFIIIGFSKSLRLLTIVYAYRYEEEIRIISARKATTSEAKNYEERI